MPTSRFRSHMRRSHRSKRFKSPHRVRGTRKLKFRKGFSAKRRLVKKVRRSARKGNSKLKTALQMASLLPDQVYLDNYVDEVATTGTTGSEAKQTMWASQQVSVLAGTSQIVPPLNLCPHDPTIIQQIMAQQVALPTSAGGGSLNQLGQLTTNANLTAQVLVKSWYVQAHITNLQTGPIEFEHYRCRARRDLRAATSTTDPDALLKNGFTDTSVAGTTGVAPPAGVTLQTLYTTFGATPFMNPRFVANVQILKTKKYRLNPGKSIRLSFKQPRPRLWKNEDFNPGTEPSGNGSVSPLLRCLKGQHFSVFVMRGTFATNSGAAAGFQVGIGNASVGIVYQHKIHYATITPQVMQSTAQNAVAGFSSSACGFPLPVVAVQPYSTINESTGSRVLASGEPFTIQDSIQTV